MISFLNKKGSAIITAVGLGGVLLIIIIGIFSFTQYRTQTVIKESKNVKALALAEAGLEIAIAELANNSCFATQKVKLEDLSWEGATSENNENTIENESSHNFSVDVSDGIISGTLGDGSFKVKVGNIPYEDNPNTVTINEEKAYVKVESIGLYENVARRVIAVINKRYPAREFLMYDGDVLSLVYGQRSGGGTNVFSTGHLYGHNGIEIGRVSLKSHNSPTTNGTNQKLNNINAILSGAGGIFFYSDIDASFKTKTGEQKSFTIQSNSSFPTGNSGYDSSETEEYGQFPENLRGVIPPVPDNLKPWIKDQNDGVVIDPESMKPRFNDFKTKAQEGGLNTDSFAEKYRIHSGWKDGTSGSGNDSIDVVYLDFGNNIHTGNVTSDNFPSNGYIYSDKDIVIKGNPPKDCCIVSEKNVFIAGDFNQRGDPSNPNEKYGFPQKYDENALKSNNYSNDILQLFKDDIDLPQEQRHHVAATIIAKERIVFDHRSPVDCFENELFPYLKYELAKGISETENESEAYKVFSPTDHTSVTVTASNTVDGFKEKVTSFTEKFKLANSDELVDKLATVYSTYAETNEGKFDDAGLEELAKQAWETYKKDYEGSMKGEPRTTATSDQGVYQLLFNLRKTMCGEEMGSESINKQGGYLCYPEMTTNAMFISCGKQANTFYAGPDVNKYYDEIGYSESTTSSYIGHWYDNTKGFVHRTFGSETNLRLFDVVKHPVSGGNTYIPPTRRKIYDDTLPFLSDYSSNPLELTGYVVLSWQDIGANKEEFDNF